MLKSRFNVESATTAQFTATNRFYQSFAEDRRVNMYLFVCAITVLLCTFTFAAEINSPCTTPNDETGTCISIESCTVIKRAIAFLNPEAIQFAKESVCGYEEYPLVCCGSTGHPTTPVPEGGTPEPEVFPNPQSFPDHVNYPFLPDSSLCGLQITEDRNATADVAKMDEFPWLAALKYVNLTNGKETFQCTGTLISNRYVVTAASCLDLAGLELYQIRLGDWKLSTFEDCDRTGKICTAPVEYDIADQIRHPHYEKQTGDNNIALIRLKEQVKYMDFIRAICLPPVNHPSPDNEQVVEASAWEFSGNGQKLKLRRYMTSAETCATIYRHNKNINTNSGCFTAHGNNSKCAVGNGSPLMRTYVKSDSLDEEQFYLEGIAYTGNTCEKTKQPCLYTRASRYTEWIAHNIRY